MFKVKDAIRRLSISKRKDTPAPLQRPLPGELIDNAEKMKEILLIGEFEEDRNDKNMTRNVQENYHQQHNQRQQNQRHEKLSFRRSETLNHTCLSLENNEFSGFNRKNSIKTRSAEDLVTLHEKRKTSQQQELQQEPQQTTLQLQQRKSHKQQRNQQRTRRKHMVQSYEPNKLLEKAIEENYTELVHGLITSGQININKLNGEGFAPLHLAAAKDKPEVIKLLIEGGAYIDILTSSGHSSLEIAVLQGNFDCAQTLIIFGADQTFVLEGPLNPRYSREFIVS